MPRFCKKSDLERSLGGASVLIELLDKNQDGVADEPLVNDAIDRGCVELASYIELQVKLGGLSEPYPLTLVFKCADAAAKYAWIIGGDGQAVPAPIEDLYQGAIRWAKDVGQRGAGLGEVPAPQLAPPAEQVDPDPTGSLVSMTGFKQSGFR